MKRMLLIGLLAMSIVFLSACNNSIVGEWICIDDGRFSNFAFSPSGQGGTFTEMELTQEYMLLNFTYTGIGEYRYTIIADNVMKLDGKTIQYELKNGFLYFYDGGAETVFKRK